MTNKVWTEQAILKLKEELIINKVEDLDELAKRLHKTRRSVMYILRKLDLLEPNKPVKYVRVTRQDIVDEIASRLDIQIDGLNLYRLDNLRAILEGIRKKK